MNGWNIRPLLLVKVGLHHLCHEAAHRLSGFILLLAGGVGVGSQGEARVVVPLHRGHGFHIYTVL